MVIKVWGGKGLGSKRMGQEFQVLRGRREGRDVEPQSQNHLSGFIYPKANVRRAKVFISWPRGIARNWRWVNEDVIAVALSKAQPP
jgi:hypothetical protein